VDLPIEVERTTTLWLNPLGSVDTGGGYAQLIADVSGHGNDPVFVISDPV